MECKDFEPSIIQEKRILRLCKRLDKFSLEDISTIADDVEESVLQLLLLTLVNEKRLTKNGDTYLYNKKICTNKQNSKLPLFFQFHTKQEADYILRGFCTDVEVFKMSDIFGFSRQVINKYYTYFRTLIYENQKTELLKHFEKTPKIPQERVYMNTKAYLYLYDNQLFVSEKYLVSKYARKHTETERLEIKNIYLRSYRKVLNCSFAHKFHLHLAEELWKCGKEFNERYENLNKAVDQIKQP